MTSQGTDPIYLDYHATTPVDPRVLEKMLPYFTKSFGNAGSAAHVFGAQAKRAVDEARADVAKVIGAAPEEIVFTSGATEAINLALFGAAEAYAKKGRHVITQVTEHKAVLEICHVMERRGCEVTYLPVDPQGRVDPQAVKAAIRSDTAIVSIMAVNNEIGTAQPVAEIGAICRAADVVFHTDIVQAVGRVPFDVDRMNVDLASFSGHKLYAPKGIGALYVRQRGRRVKVKARIVGGGQEAGLRAGTLNVPGIVGLGEACRLYTLEGPAEQERMRTLAARLRERIMRGTDGVTLNGHPTERHPGNVHLSFAFVEAKDLLETLEGVAVSSGSACSSGSHEPSHVVRAIGMDEELMLSCVRFGLGRFTTEHEVDTAAEKVVRAVNELRARNPLYRHSKRGP